MVHCPHRGLWVEPELLCEINYQRLKLTGPPSWFSGLQCPCRRSRQLSRSFSYIMVNAKAREFFSRREAVFTPSSSPLK